MQQIIEQEHFGSKECDDWHQNNQYTIEKHSFKSGELNLVILKQIVFRRLVLLCKFPDFTSYRITILVRLVF
jgi:hypothetical protein